MRNATLSVATRTLALVRLRRLIAENWSSRSEAIKTTLKAELLTAVQQEQENSLRKKITDVVAELARFLIDHLIGTSRWPELLTFLFEMSSSPNVVLREASLNIFTSFPGTFGNQETHYMQVIHQLLARSLADTSKAISFLAVKPITASIKNHEKEMNIIMGLKDCLPLILHNVKLSIEGNTDNEDLQKCLIEIAQIAPKYLKNVLDDVFEVCINVSGHCHFGAVMFRINSFQFASISIHFNIFQYITIHLNSFQYMN
jgi:hypothetical protein